VTDPERIIRAWKNEDFRQSLSLDERNLLPDNPAGLTPLSDVDLEAVSGAGSEHVLTVGCCPGLTSDSGFCSLFCPCTTSDYCCCIQSATPYGCCPG